MPFRERLKSIVKGEVPVFEHLRHRRAEHIDRRRPDVGPSRDRNLFQQDHNLARDERATEAAVADSGPAYTTQEHARKHEDTVRDEIGSSMGGRTEGHTLKDPLRDRGASENTMRHEEAPVEVKGRSDTGGGGYDVDRRTKAPPPPPPTTTPAAPQRLITDPATRYALFLSGATRAGYYRENRPKPTGGPQDDPRVPYGPQQDRLAVTRDGVIQDQQAISESMAIDDTSVEEPGLVYTSRQDFDRPAPSRHLSDERLYRSPVPATERLDRVQTATEPGTRDSRSRSYPDEYMSKGAMYSVPPPALPENNPVHGRSTDDIYVTEGPSGYYTSALIVGLGGGEQRRGDMREITAPPTVGAGGRDRVLSDTPIDKDVRWCMREDTAPLVMEGGAMRMEDRIREYKTRDYKLSSGGKAESSIETHTPRTPGTTAELKRASSTPTQEYNIPPTAESSEEDRKLEEQESRDRVAIPATARYTTKDREYTTPTTSTSPTQYSTLHNILPSAYGVDPEEGPFHRSVSLGGRSSSALSNRSDMSNLIHWGLDPTAGVYEITNYGGGKRAPVMGVEEEGEWYKDDPVRAGCYCEAGGGGAARIKGGDVGRYEVVKARKEEVTFPVKGEEQVRGRFGVGWR